MSRMPLRGGGKMPGRGGLSGIRLPVTGLKRDQAEKGSDSGSMMEKVLLAGTRFQHRLDSGNELLECVCLALSALKSILTLH